MRDELETKTMIISFKINQNHPMNQQYQNNLVQSFLYTGFILTIPSKIRVGFLYIAQVLTDMMLFIPV